MPLSSLIGNSAARQAWIRMVDSGHIPNAILFHENDGGGALPFVLACLQYLFCTDRHGADACGTCPACNRVGKLIHPDIHFVFPVNSGSRSSSSKPTSDTYLTQWRELVARNPWFLESDLGDALGLNGKQGVIAVEEAKAILEKLSLHALEGGFQAVVLYLPERMNAAAANKLLKIVEEPPSQCLFLMITHDPDAVLQTIRSRCQLIRVAPLRPEEVAQVLVRDFSEDPARAAEVASYSDGSVGTALAHLSEESGFHEIRGLVTSLLDALAARDYEAALDAGDAVAALSSREKQKAFCTFAGVCVRNLFLCRQMPELAALPSGERAWYGQRAQALGPKFCSRAEKVLTVTETLLEGNVNQKILFCDMVNRLYMSVS